MKPVCCSMSSSNCCFLTCIQISQQAGSEVWYSHLFKNFLQFVFIHTIKVFGIVNKAEVDVFLELSCSFDDSTDVDNLISGSSAFSKSSLNIWKFTVHVLLKPGLQLSYDLAIPLLSIHLERTIIWKDTCILVFTEMLFTMAKTWKHPKYPLMNG